MATTIRQLITGALRLINVVQANETPSPEDMDIALSAFEALVDSWSNDKLMIYTLSPYLFDLTGGQSSYLLGPGGDWNITRPMRIEQAYVVLNNGTPQALDIEMKGLNDAQYASIAVKNTTSSYPYSYYDNGNYPIRTVYVWPVPTISTKIKLWLHEPLLNFTSLDDPLVFPPGYERMYRYNLAVELASEWGKDPSAQVMGVAESSRTKIKMMNFSPDFMSCDGGCNSNRAPFNWISGGFIPWSSK